MTPWEQTQTHEADNITLLCLEHHGKKTLGLLSEEQVRAHNENPHNVRSGVSAPFALDFGGHGEAQIVLATSTFASTAHFAPVVIDNAPVIKFVSDPESGWTLSLTLFDRHNRPTLAVVNNELVFSTAEHWDIQFRGQVLTVRSGLGQIYARIRFEPPNSVIIEKAYLRRNGVEVVVANDAVTISDGNSLVRHEGSQNFVSGFAVGYSIGWPMPPLQTAFAFQVDRYPNRGVDVPGVGDDGDGGDGGTPPAPSTNPSVSAAPPP